MQNNITKDEMSIFQDVAETGMMHSLTALSRLSRREWNLFPHEFKFSSFAEAGNKFPGKEPARYCGELSFSGETPLSILCVFNQESMLNLTHYINEHEAKSEELSSLQTLTVAEVSNILANTFLNVFANTIGMKILPRAPRVMVGTRAMMIKEAASRMDQTADLLLSSEMRLESGHMTMSGDMLILFSETSFKPLIAKIKKSPTWDEKAWHIF